jgi:hypothetical protein
LSTFGLYLKKSYTSYIQTLNYGEVARHKWQSVWKMHWYTHGAIYAIRSHITVLVQCLNEFRLVYARKAGTSNVDNFLTHPTYI